MRTGRIRHPLDCSREPRARHRRSLNGGILLLTLLILQVAVRAQAAGGLDYASVGCGELLWRTEAGLIPLPSVATDVQLRVGGPLVAGRIVQRFLNPTDEAVEAVYVFPLPEQASVVAMEIVIGERRIVSVVREKAQARREYETARAEGRRAALVESARPNLFTTRVANICPGETVEVVLEYDDTVDYAAGVFSLTFPLTFTPRFVPPNLLSGGTPGEEGIDAERAERLLAVLAPFAAPGDARFPRAVLRVELAAGLPVVDLHSPSHAVRIDDGVVTLRDGDTAADRDFRLEWSAVLDGPAAACFIEDRPEGRYALVMLVPDTAAPADGPATETLFVIDVSGSMQGPSIRQARAALLRAVDRLRPGDRFNILAFNDDSRLFRRGLQPAVPETLADARGWIGALDADGGTMMHPALLQAARQFLAAGPPATGTGRRIILITDAAIGNESQLLREAAGGLGDVRLHIVGIGAAPNRFLVRRLAELGGGLSAFVADADAAGGTLDAFLARIDRPVLRDLRLEWTGGAPRESSPVRLPELFAGQPLLWSGLFPADARVSGRLTGLDDDGAWSCELGRPVEAAGTAARWARLSIDGLMAELYAGGSADTLRARVIDIALAHGLVTEYTSRVAVETTPTGQPPARTCRLPNGLPAGSRLLDALPATGTSRPLLTLLSLVLMGLGGGGLWLLRRRAAVR